MITEVDRISYAKQKLTSAIKLVKKILQGDWPHIDSKIALERILEQLNLEIKLLENLDKDASTDIIHRRCQNAKRIIASQIGLISFILRSSNLRNSFESYFPIKVLGSELLNLDIKLVVGSEWNYTPFLFPLEHAHLSDFIFVGLPATESDNSLLLPIAGHELGHAVWRKGHISSGFRIKLREKVVETIRSDWKRFSPIFEGHENANEETISEDLELVSLWSEVAEYCKSQIEEIFCDIMGTRLFGASYAYAFLYVLSSDIDEKGSKHYPTHTLRAAAIDNAAKRFEIPDIDVSSCIRLRSETRPLKVVLASLAAESLVPDAIESVEVYCKKIPLPSSAAIDDAFGKLRALTPIHEGSSMAEILNAAWRIRNGISTWEIPGVVPERRPAILNDLVFKSFEIAEWTQRSLPTQTGLL
jgi:hypothetical protein